MGLILTILLAGAPTLSAEYQAALSRCAELSGEPEALVATIMQPNHELVRYCTHWEPTGDNRVWCSNSNQASCYEGCQGKRKVWRNRLDIGLFDLRCPPARVGGKRVRGFSQCRAYGVEPECAMDPMCAAEVAAKVILEAKRLPPKPCHLRGVPDEYGSWIAHYAGGGECIKKCCAARARRLKQAGIK